MPSSRRRPASADRRARAGDRRSSERLKFTARRAVTVVLACAAVLSMSALIGACGSGGKGSSTEDKGGVPNKAQAQADAVKFAKCMREHGVKVETSTTGGGTQTKIGGSSSEVNPTELKDASKDCRKYMPNEGKAIKLSPAEEAKDKEAAAKFARCLRSHGIDVTESSSGTLELPSGVGPNDKSFEDAQKDCQGVMGDLPLRMSSKAPNGEASSMESATRVGAPAGGGE
jgi:hypothetical protein